MKSLIRVWPWLKPYWRYAAASAAATFVSVVINLLIPIQTARVIDQGIAEGDSAFVRQTVLVMVALICLGMAFAAFASAMAVRMAFHTVTDLRQDLYDHAQSLSFGNLDRRSSGELLTRLTSDVTKLQAGLTMGVAIVSRAPIMLIGALVAIVSLDASLSIVALVMLPFVGIIFWYVVGRSGLLYDAVQTRLDRLNTVLQENIEGAELVKAFVRQDHETERFDEVADDLAQQAIAVNQLVASLMPALIAVASFGIAAVLWIGGGNVIEGSLSEGNLVAFISYMVMVAMPLIMFSFLQPMLTSAGTSMGRIDEVLSDLPEVVDTAAGHGTFTQPLPGDVMFDGVSFAYASQDDNSQLGYALDNINLHIPQGQTVAILGATGSGKSTLIHMIPRFYDAITGVVSVGGDDVRNQPLDQLRATIGIALQVPRLFTGTIAENIRVGWPDASEESVVAVAMAAQAHGFISELADGYQSQVEQGGANLSGGQRQRLSIARTLLSNPDVLILDDSTSAVDLETEVRIQEALEAYEKQTVILVAQRISTALGADRIVVMDHGRIEAQGTHEELIAHSRLYQEIYESQLGESIS